MSSQKFVLEQAKEITVRDEVDVVICGGGPAGMCAALASARMGMKTVLIEQYGFLGGANTAAGVNGIGGWQHDLDGRLLIDGIAKEIMYRLGQTDAARMEQIEEVFTPRNDRPTYREGGLGCYWISVNPEYMKIVMDQMMEKENVCVIYHASAVAPIMQDKTVCGIFVESKSGREAILSKVVVDCTGDGDIAARAGADFDVGRPEDGACQPMSMIFTVGNADVKHLNYDLEKDEKEIEPLVRNRYEGAVRQARNNGEILYNPNDIFCAATPIDYRYSEVRSVNFTRIQKLSAIDAETLTQAEILGRKQVLEAVQFMRKYVEGCKEAYLISMPPHIGIRESRRIKGKYVLTGEDILCGKRFDDAIMRGIYVIDTHNPTEIGKPSTLKLLDQPYDIPYRCLIPEKIENLLVAGRCISGDATALSSFRIQSHCMAIGEAAGTAAAIAIKSRCSVKDVDTDSLRSTLTENGSNVGVGL